MSVLKENIKYHALLYLISPMLGLIYGIRSRSINYLRWSIFVFTVIYGSLFTFALFGGEQGVNKGADGARHLDNVYSHYQYLEFSVWWEELIAILSFAPKAGTSGEPYIHILSYIIGGVFNVPGLFFVGVAIVYGYFFSGAIVKILSYVNWKSGYNKFYFTFFLIMLVLWKNPADMQTVRTWTGLWVLIYAAISYYQTKKKKYLLLILVPPFIHIGFTAMALPVWLVLFSGFRNPKVYFIIFLISTLSANVTQQAEIFDQVAQTSEVGESKVKAYSLNEERLERSKKDSNKSQANFYKRYEQLGIHRQVLSGMIIFIFLFLRKKRFGNIENTLFSLGIALATFANFTSYIYALHNRTWHIASIFILALMVVFLSKQNLKQIRFSFLKIRLPLFLFFIALIPYFLLKVSMFINLSSAFVLILPVFSWINSDLGISIKDVIVTFI